MSRYESSIKCKYCRSFEPGANRCHLYHDFDQSRDRQGGGPYYKETSSDSRCSHFCMTAMDAVASGVVKNRPDGSFLVDLDDDPELKRQLQSEESSRSSSGGCYVATCVYGSYDCPQVWTLRRFRDTKLASTWYGRAFVRTYYAVSPALVRWLGDTTWFRQFWKRKLDTMVDRLQKDGIASTPYQDKEW